MKKDIFLTGSTAFVVLIFFAIPQLRNTSFEVGDFAANSLLIQDAKSLSLLHGHYSRLGFHHPGPALLYVLALGEAVFHDWLALTTPIGAQLIAVAFYSAFWISLIFAGKTLLFACPKAAALGLAALLCVTALRVPEAFLGLWPPHMFYFPFCAFTIAVALMIRGDSRSLPLMAASSGLLVNGHVSFLAILGIMVLSGFSAHVALAKSRASLVVVDWLSLQTLKSNLSIILVSLAIFFFFLFPFILNNVLNNFKPFWDYFVYSRSNAGHRFQDAARFLAVFLGVGASAAIAISLALAVFAVAYSRSLLTAATIALVAAVFTATVATLVYLTTGVDFLDPSFDYVISYYSAAPGLSFSIIIVFLLNCLKTRFKSIFLTVGLFSLSGQVFMSLHQPASYASQYDRREIAEVHALVSSLGSDLALNLNASSNWEALWPMIAGLQAYTRRYGASPFCINRNWHLLFTDAARCTAEQLVSARGILVTADPASRPKAEFLGQAAGIQLYADRLFPIMRGGEMYRAGAHGGLAEFLATGWSTMEKELVWSNGSTAILLFHTMPDIRWLELDVDAFRPGSHRQRVTVEINDIVVGELFFDATNDRRRELLRLPSTETADPLMALRFRIHDATSPKELGVSGDSRRLGIALFGLRGL